MALQGQIKSNMITLNNIDISQFFQNFLDINDLMDTLEEKYGKHIFDDMSILEFIDYLKLRYPQLHIYETTQYKIGRYI